MSGANDMGVSLRPFVADDLPVPGTSESEYDDFGPTRTITTPPPADLGSNGYLAIVVEGRVIGDVAWHWVGYGPGDTSRCPNLGISITSPDDRGHGHGTIAQRLLISLFFQGTIVNRVEASTDVTNLAEQRSLEKAGFTREGVVRGAQWRRGAFHDLVTYSVLRSEWSAGLSGS